MSSILKGNVFVRSRLGVRMEHFRRKCVRQKSKEMCSSGVVWGSMWNILKGNVFARNRLGVNVEHFLKEMYSSGVIWGLMSSILKGNVFVRNRLGVHKEHFIRKCVRQTSPGGKCGAL